MHPIEETVRRLPTQPGVYLMKGENGKVLYVGKAKNLRARVRSYLGSGGEGSPKVRFLMSKVRSLDTIVTGTEKEALLLENTLIKRFRPRYNVNLKDDKTYLHLLLDRNHPYPRLLPVRRPDAGPGRLLFGPYSSASAMRDTLRQILRVYPLRTCGDRELQARKRPCLQYQMGRCCGPCRPGEVSVEAYGRMVEQAILILRGKSDELLRQLEGEMKEAAEEMRFEEAARLRDRIAAIRLTMESQRVVSSGGLDADVYGLYGGEEGVEIALLLVRGGTLIERRGFPFPETIEGTAELLRSFLLQYYSRPGREPPAEILLPVEPEDRAALEELLGEIRGRPCRLRVPRRGERARIVELAGLNAKTLFEEHVRERRGRRGSLEEIRRRLGLRGLPERIECVDISTLQGGQAVGSIVVFLEGRPHPDGYRRYRIRGGGGMNDYAMMYEVLHRRFRHREPSLDPPDLLLVDGGKGQLGVAVRVLEDLGVQGVRVAAIAKGRGREEGPGGKTGTPEGRGTDRIYLPGRANPASFPVHSKGFALLQHLRDEAHRFAVGYHRRLRSKEMRRSELDGIPGLGPKRKQALLEGLGDLEKIRRASLEELRSVPGVGPAAAAAVWRHFHPEEGPGA